MRPLSTGAAEPAATVAVVTWLVGGVNTLVAMTILAAWWGASMQVTGGDQYVYLDIAAAAVIAGGLANAAALVRLRRAIGLARVRIVRAGDMASAALRAASPTATATPATESLVTSAVTAKDMLRYHRASCPLLRGKAASPANPSVLEACGVCEP